MQFRKWLVMILALCVCVPLVASAQTGGFGPPVLVSPVDGWLTNYAWPRFQWEATQGAVSYQGQLSSSANFTTGVQTFAVSNRTYYYSNDRQTDGIYYWRMRAYDGTLYSDWSESRQFELETVPPLAPVMLGPAAGSIFMGTRPTFSWEPVSDAVSYSVAAYHPYGRGGKFSVRVDAPATSLTLDDDLYIFHGLYRWYVVAVDAAGNRSTGNTYWDIILDSAEDAAPDLYFYGLETNNQVSLRWSAIDRASVYHIQVARDPDFSQIVRENDTLTVPEDIHRAYLYNIIDNYYWRVRAGQGNGIWGPWSETSSFVPSRDNYYTPSHTPSPTEWPTATATLTPSPTFTPTATLGG